jgi:cobalt-zinc-cadmium resistance protein CzcA
MRFPELGIRFIAVNDGVDSFHSRTQVTERLSSADLPVGVRPALAPDYTPLGEIYKFILSSDRHSLYELRSEMEWNVSRVLRQVQGVADVLTFGGFYKEIHVEIDPVRMESFGLTLEEINQAIATSNRNVGAGFFLHGDQQMVIRGVGFLRSPEDVRKIVLKSAGGTPVTVGDVSRLVQSATPRQGAVGLDDQKETVQGIVLLRRGQNPSRVLDAVHESVESLNHGMLPAGMLITPFLDRTELVHRTLHTVYDNLLYGFLLVLGVVWLFLRSLRASLIVALVIPLSLLVAFLGLYQLGLPANLISMGAIDFGIILDGAVVVVENVIHQVNHHRPASRRGVLKLIGAAALEVSRPTFYAMLIIIAALIPVFTLERVEGRIFRPLALTYSFALVGGLVFALTVVPALCATVLRNRDLYVEEPRFLILLRTIYARLLGLAR